MAPCDTDNQQTPRRRPKRKVSLCKTLSNKETDPIKPLSTFRINWLKGCAGGLKLNKETLATLELATVDVILERKADDCWHEYAVSRSAISSDGLATLRAMAVKRNRTCERRTVKTTSACGTKKSKRQSKSHEFSGCMGAVPFLRCRDAQPGYPWRLYDHREITKFYARRIAIVECQHTKFHPVFWSCRPDKATRERAFHVSTSNVSLSRKLSSLATSTKGTTTLDDLHARSGQKFNEAAARDIATAMNSTCWVREASSRWMSLTIRRAYSRPRSVRHRPAGRTHSGTTARKEFRS